MGRPTLGKGLIWRTVRGTEWSELLDYVSPSFLDVVPARSLWSQAREMVRNSRDDAGFERVLGGVEKALAERGTPIAARRSAPRGEELADTLDGDARRTLGQHVLELYFVQLLAGDATVLDLRAGRFRGDADAPLWHPRPFWIGWEPEFLEALRDMYAGFYGGDDARFRDAVARLDLEPAEDVFRAHFGDGDQRHVAFRTRSFQSTFHEAFVRCRDAGVTLHRNFLSLGLYLACLYEHLERLEVEFDVRAAFDRAAAR